MSVNNNLQTGSGRIRVAKFTASGSWVAPAGVYSIQALAVGGGGGGGASRSNSSTLCYMGGGGGGGGVIDGIFPVVPGTTYTVTIGTGGAGANGSATGANGTNTTFGSLFTAPGGQGGASRLRDGTFIPTTNPGGSMGGWAHAQSGTALASAGHGSGAATPILLCAASSALSVNDAYSSVPFTFFNGVSNVTIPITHVYETETNFRTSLAVNYNTISSTTRYLGVKRNDVSYVPANTSWIPGYSWKGLGAGGASLLTFGTVDAGAAINAVYLEPSAGSVPVTRTLVPNANTTTVNGTNGQDNTGAGGGGSIAGGTSDTIASGGTGGSGYVEVVWQE